jgi:CubicO group peptidase (beta-lactamase class C family)
MENRQCSLGIETEARFDTTSEMTTMRFVHFMSNSIPTLLPRTILSTSSKWIEYLEAVSHVFRAFAWSCFVFLCLPAMAAERRTHTLCDELLPHMRQSHIPDLAIAEFVHKEVNTYYCSVGTQQLAPGAVFEVASLSKAVFAAAVLALVQQGKLDLDRPLATYLPGPYRHEQNPFGQGPSDTVSDPRINRVTTRMVLSHTTGLPNWSRRQPLAFLADPGQKWGYSGEGYVYLQRAVETITGEPIQSFVQETVFGPLGMTRSSFVWRSDLPNKALLPHTANGSEGKPEHYTTGLASSTLYTTLDDYSKFVMALLYPKPGSVFALEETKQVEVDAEIKLEWGLGVAIEDRPRKAYFHWGANPGFQSFFMVQPVSGRGVLFLTDSDNGLDLVDEIVGRFIPGEHPVLRFPMLHPKD